MRYTRHLVAATLTVVTVSSVTSAILPGSDSSRPSDGTTYARQYSNNHAQELSESRLRANVLGDAINADHLRSAEFRAADDAAGAAADALLRRP